MRRLASMILMVFGLVGLVSPAWAEKRVALVVGNSSYDHVSRLANPTSDARLMAETLQALGFLLVGNRPHLDLDKSAFDRAVQDFGALLQGADVGLFYYAGHGLQVRGSNYLVPIGANPAREADVDFQMLDTNLVLRQMEGAGTRLNLVILDACRNNPFAGRGLRSSASGLAQITAPEGTLISFATQPGNVAADGEDGNSPYTKALARTIRRPGLGVFDAFNEVGLAVKQATRGAQQPWVSSSPIAGTFYFAGLAPQLTAQPSLQESTVDPSDRVRRDYEFALQVGNKEAWDAFLTKYPTGYHADLARAQRQKLLLASAPATAPAAPAAPAPPPPASSSVPLRLSRADVIRLFTQFSTIFDRVRADFVEPVDDSRALLAAIEGMRSAFPPAVSTPLPRLEQLASTARSGGVKKPNLNPVYDTAVQILDHRFEGDDKRLLEAAITAMLGSIDPASSYLNPKEFRDMQVSTRGEFGGIGIEVTMVDGLVKVVSPLEGTPAAKAGLITGDLITEIDGEPVQGLTLNQAVGKLRGLINTPVRLRIVRKGASGALELSIVRETVRVRAARSQVEGDDVGYIQVFQFNELTTDAVKKAITDISQQIPSHRLKGYVIDLRNNPGGLLDQAISVSDLFLERGEIASTRGRKIEETQRFNAREGDATGGKPLVVLINGGSASVSEIVAGALQDHKRATLVGTRSFGKGGVQTIIPLGAGQGALRLTTARYFTPSGRSFEAKGILPDIEVADPSAVAPSFGSASSKDDPVLSRALAVLRGRSVP